VDWADQRCATVNGTATRAPRSPSVAPGKGSAYWGSAETCARCAKPPPVALNGPRPLARFTRETGGRPTPLRQSRPAPKQERLKTGPAFAMDIIRGLDLHGTAKL